MSISSAGYDSLGERAGAGIKTSFLRRSMKWSALGPGLLVRYSYAGRRAWRRGQRRRKAEKALEIFSKAVLLAKHLPSERATKPKSGYAKFTILSAIFTLEGAIAPAAARVCRKCCWRAYNGYLEIMPAVPAACRMPHSAACADEAPLIGLCAMP